jgi:outer membrane lipoprotein SlyB
MAWYNRHKALAGAATGFVAGSFIPGIGNLVGAVAGALIGPAVIEDERRRRDGTDEKRPDSRQGGEDDRGGDH